MKTIKWIRIIGSACIVFGALGIISSISLIILPLLVDTSAENQQLYQQFTIGSSSWYLYTGLVVNIIYLLAGIFYLLQKVFSLKLMYTALFLSVLYSIVSMFIYYIETGVETLLWGHYFSYLLSILIDLVIFIGIIKVAKHINSSDFVLKNDIIANTINHNRKSRLIVLSSLAGLVTVSVPVIILGLWIYASKLGTTYEECQEIYKSFLPQFLHKRFYPTYLSMIFGVFTYLLVIQGLKSSTILWKALNIIVLSICTLLMMFNLWTMM